MVKADRRRKDLPKLKDKSQLMSFPVQPLGKTTGIHNLYKYFNSKFFMQQL